ncbi:MAG: twitching motility protein PilT [Myxococcota bacterium]|jgi:twitching motility protein PilT
MSTKQAMPLLGRLAIQCKMITMEQLQEATGKQGRDPERRLGDILVDLGFLDDAQIQKLKKLQRELVIKHRAKQAASGRTVPERPQPKVNKMTPDAGSTVDRPFARSAEMPQAAKAEPPKPVAEQQPPAAPVDLALNKGHLNLSIVEPTPENNEVLHALLRDAVTHGASDIHLHSGAPVRRRINGAFQDATGSTVGLEEVEALVSATLTPAQRAELCEYGELDLCYDVSGVGRFRCNIYRQQRGFDAVYRSIPEVPPTLESLGLPSALAKHTNYHQGMVLVTGPAGCGKSSTMAALVNLINEERDEHILTIEDPIEYVHPSKRCLVNQRHAGRHTDSFARALRGALREDPDVIVIGELRDLETISLAMTAAETGHFVLATLHTSNAVRTVSRMIGAFPSNQQSQVRTMLSESLRCVISQRLVVAADGSGRIPALELLVINKAIGNLIRDEKTIQIRSAIQTGAAHGMCLLEQSLNEMVRAGQITRDEALRIAEDKKLITA